MPTEIATWLALLFCVAVSLFLGLLIWRHKEPPSGAFVAFAAFAALPVLVLSVPEILPKLTGYCVMIEGKQYCLSQLAKDVKEAKQIADSANVKATNTKNALEETVSSPPIVSIPTQAGDKAAKPACRPYIRSDGYRPSAGLLLVGQNKKNWFAVISSIYGKDNALAYADRIAGKVRYPVYVYQAKDEKGEPVWAITLEGYLTQEQAVDRVCYAQTEGNLAKDAYAWASDKWGSNIRVQ
jgi:hypothetical protein